MALKRNSQEEQNRLSLLFHAYDVDHSGRIEKSEFSAICRDLCVPSREAEGIFNRLDADKDGTVTLEELLDGFTERHKKKRDDDEEEDENLPSLDEFSTSKEQVISR
ncbi:ras and EF-hand domain-containing protein-like [Oryzias melastigma]|uniref:ras and EF-hand domain-containing protein-like n=1 Tax=Oryzias melastigma TaxID=30732 RepID=UPI00168CECB0|nr:ras and EF-hand domain-containing protein-like [Oryzias melastigma]